MDYLRLANFIETKWKQVEKKPTNLKALLLQLPKISKELVGASRFERPVQPPHPLGGVPRVAPYSSRRHPPALPQSVGC